MAERYDVIVIGVGAMGAAACWQLSLRGVRVLGVEQFEIAHGLGSSGGQTRLIRMAYYEHPDYVPLLRRAYENWDSIGEEAGEPVIVRTGGLYLGDPDREFIAGSKLSADLHGLAYAMLDGDELARRFDQFRVPERFAAMHEPAAGFVYSERAIAAFAKSAAAHGATIRPNETVKQWSADGGGVTVVTDRDTYQGGQLVVTAGAWAGKLLPRIAPRLTVTRQALGWVEPKRPERFTLGAFPCWAIEDDAPGFDGIYYGFPMLGDGAGLKLAHHAAGDAADPDALDRATRDADEADFRPALRKYLPEADGPLRSMHVCMYTTSPDHHFIVDRHPQHPNVAIACGFSGHGFKFASVIGEALADLATRGDTKLPIGFLGLDRFPATS